MDFWGVKSRSRRDLARLIAVVCAHFEIDVVEIVTRSRNNVLSVARGVICLPERKDFRDCQVRPSRRDWETNPPAVSKAIQRGKIYLFCLRDLPLLTIISDQVILTDHIMPTINVAEAKSQLSRLLDAAAAGEEVIISRRGKACVRLVPLDLGPRKPGALTGKIMLDEDFFDPLPPQELHAWSQ